jgi:4-aminobutyrate aminotransferase-like enzyme
LTTWAFTGELTYSGHPLAWASIVAAIDEIKQEDVLENAALVGTEVLGRGLRELAARDPVIGEVRGLAVFWARDLVSDRASRSMLAPVRRLVRGDERVNGGLPVPQPNAVCQPHQTAAKYRHVLTVYDARLRPLPARFPGWGMYSSPTPCVSGSSLASTRWQSSRRASVSPS